MKIYDIERCDTVNLRGKNGKSRNLLREFGNEWFVLTKNDEYLNLFNLNMNSAINVKFDGDDDYWVENIKI